MQDSYTVEGFDRNEPILITDAWLSKQRNIWLSSAPDNRMR